MFDFKLPPLILGTSHAPVPIVQGGMGVGISMQNLAAAVASEGGVGVISAAGIGMLRHPAEPDHQKAIRESLAEEIAAARAKIVSHAPGILGVNIMTAMSDFAEMVKASAGAGIDVIFSGAGLPLDLPKYASSATALVPIVSSAKAVKMISRWWQEKYRRLPDGFVLEGPKAGGHLGFSRAQLDDPEFSLESLVGKLRSRHR